MPQDTQTYYNCKAIDECICLCRLLEKFFFEDWSWFLIVFFFFSPMSLGPFDVRHHLFGIVTNKHDFGIFLEIWEFKKKRRSFVNAYEIHIFRPIAKYYYSSGFRYFFFSLFYCYCEVIKWNVIHKNIDLLVKTFYCMKFSVWRKKLKKNLITFWDFFLLFTHFLSRYLSKSIRAKVIN